MRTLREASVCSFQTAAVDGWSDLLARAEIYHTSFITESFHVLQLLSPSGSLPCESCILSCYPQHAKMKEHGKPTSSIKKWNLIKHISDLCTHQSSEHISNLAAMDCGTLVASISASLTSFPRQVSHLHWAAFPYLLIFTSLAASKLGYTSSLKIPQIPRLTPMWCHIVSSSFFANSLTGLWTPLG